MLSVLVIQYVYRVTHIVSNLLVVLPWHMAGGQGCGTECTQAGEGEREGAGKEGNRGGGRVRARARMLRMRTTNKTNGYCVPPCRNWLCEGCVRFVVMSVYAYDYYRYP